MTTKYAFISLTDTREIVSLINPLIEAGYRIIATDGTYKLLRRYRDDILLFSSLFSKPALSGLVKTLDYRFYLSILADAESKTDIEFLDEKRIPKISLYIVNLYLLQSDELQNANTSSIDVGGVSILRAASKNHKNNLVITDPNDYDELAKRLREERVDPEYRVQCAIKAFSYVANYDEKIVNYLSKSQLPDVKYGENPHVQLTTLPPNKSSPVKMYSYENRRLSLNNYTDLELALNLMRELNRALPRKKIAIFIKHGIPAAVAISESVDDAIRTAYSADPSSNFGGVLLTNGVIDTQSIDFLSEIFLEVIAAFGYDDSVDKLLEKRKRIRIVRITEEMVRKKVTRLTNTRFALFEQDEEERDLSLRIVTKTKIENKYYEDMLAAWFTTKYVRSNAVVIFSNACSRGIGSGRVSRVESAKDAANMYRQNRENLLREEKLLIAASDGFFPFADAIEILSAVNIQCIIQPGGSLRDQKIIEYCDIHGISMYFTDIRAFYHG
jgi:phosphoribosylaminoimidazolecarboxamide formyltransferase/IMP cyclohydrolase